MIVVDASVLAPALVDEHDDGALARSRLSGESLAAPALIDLETASAIRRVLLSGDADAARATAAIDQLRTLPVHRARHSPLLARCWELRDNLTVYDAAYVALAELMDLTLLTADARLAGAPGPRCPIELLA